MNKVIENSLNLLTKNNKMEVYVKLNDLQEGYLFMKYNDELICITRSSGVYEFDLGEYMLDLSLEKGQLKAAKNIMNSLAITDSIKQLPHLGMIGFKLDEPYMSKLRELDDIHFEEYLKNIK